MHAANESNMRRVMIALVLTGSFMVVEVVGGILSGSLALLADAGHMLTDTMALALAAFAFHVSKRPADGNLTYAIAKEGSILFYGLAGANFSLLSSAFDGADRQNKFMPALNIGTGIEMIVEKDINAFAQVRGVVGSYAQYVAISIGVHYYFNGRRFRTW